MKNPLLRIVAVAVPAAAIMLAVSTGQASAAQEPVSAPVSHGVSAASAAANRANGETAMVLNRTTNGPNQLQCLSPAANGSGCDSTSTSPSGCDSGCPSTAGGSGVIGLGLGLGIGLPHAVVGLGVDLGNLLTVGLGIGVDVVNGMIVGFDCP
jgi:hypothetical protein